LIESGTQIDISLLDHAEQHVLHALLFAVDEVGVEENLRGLKSLGGDLDDTTIWESVVLYKGGGLESEALLDLEIVADVTQLLLDETNSLKISRSVEVVATNLEEFDEVTGDVTTSDVEALDEERRTDTLPDGDNVCDTITRINDDTGEETLGGTGPTWLECSLSRQRNHTSQTWQCTS